MPIFAAICAALLLCAGATPFFCGDVINGGPPPMQPESLQLGCQLPGATISAISFASYGTASGWCGSLVMGSCNAANTTAVVSKACLGQNQCSVSADTATFGDPCFGTVKHLIVQAVCSSGAGWAQPPLPPPPAPPDAVVTVDWQDPWFTLVTAPTLQVVAHHLLMRDSPIHDKCFDALAQLGARHVRYVPWFPYAMLGVAELNPPSGHNLCGGLPVSEGYELVLDCGSDGGNISQITFASFGTPSGVCGSFSLGSCHASNSASVVEDACLGKQQCSILVADATFRHDPCFGTAKTLAVQATCSNPSKQHTYWNFTYPDQMMMDVWNAVNPSGGEDTAPIINFSTPPNWFYDNSWAYPDNPATPWYGYETGTQCKNYTALGEYYGRLVAWYTQAGFYDEYGTWHGGGHDLNISIWEVLNEVAHEHDNTPQSYTLVYDAMVQGIRKLADPDHLIAFVGLNLANIESEQTVIQWAEYFLNASNHAPGIPLDFIAYHAYPTGSYDTNPASFEGFFSYVDGFVEEANAVDAVRKRLSPSTGMLFDECGSVDPAAAQTPTQVPLYWVASGSYFAYLFARLAPLGVLSVGESQLMDSPGQEPSVTMLDWNTGQPTAKYWVLKLLIEYFPAGGSFYPTSSNCTGVFAQGYLPNQHSATRTILLINKVYATATVTLAGVGSAQMWVIDAQSAEGPPRSVAVANGVVSLGAFATAVIVSAAG